MKKFISFIILIFAGMALMGQASAIIGSVTGTTNGTGTANLTIPAQLWQEYDYSYQVIPALSGAGDSVNNTGALWQMNALSGTWTEIPSARDTATSTAGFFIEGTDAKGLQHRVIVTGVSGDTVTHTLYYVLKLPKVN